MDAEERQTLIPVMWVLVIKGDYLPDSQKRKWRRGKCGIRVYQRRGDEGETRNHQQFSKENKREKDREKWEFVVLISE